MHLLLTDRLTCPRCGPGFGLILLADRLADRRVVDGKLGCSNCRDAFLIHDGFGDLRAPPRGGLPEGRAGKGGPTTETDVAERWQALLGVAEGPGTIVLVGSAARQAGALARSIDGVEIVAMDADLAAWPEVPHVSRMVSGPGLPFFDRTLRGAVVDGALAGRWIAEGARVVARLSRVIVVEASDDARVILEGAGLQLLAEEAGTVLAARA